MDEFDKKDIENDIEKLEPEQIEPEQLEPEEIEPEELESDEFEPEEYESEEPEAASAEAGTAEAVTGRERRAAGATAAAGPASDRSKQGKTGKKNSKPTLTSRVIEWYKGLRSEFRKVVWPSRRELARQSATVILTSLLFAVIIAAFDFASSEALALFGHIVLK